MSKRKKATKDGKPTKALAFSARKQPHWLRWLFFYCALVISFTGTIVFYWAHRDVPEAQVQLDVTTRNLTVFALPDEVSRAFSSILTSGVYISNFQKVKLGGGRFVPPAATSSFKEVTLEASEYGASALISPAVVKDINFAAGSKEVRISLSWSGTDKAILGAEISSVRQVVLSASASRSITCNYCRLGGSARPLRPQFKFISSDSLGEQASLEPIDGQLSLRLDLQSGRSWHIQSLPIAKTILFQHSAQGHTDSSILNGTIKLPGVKGDEVWKTLAPKTKFRIDGLQYGFSLQDVWIDGGIHVAANGIVRAIVVGEGESNVLPNRLARWNQTEPIAIYAALATVVLTLCYNALILIQTRQQLEQARQQLGH